MLLFLDESYERLSEGSFRHVIGGFCLPAARYRDLIAAVESTKERHFVQDRNMSPEERMRAWEEHFVVGDVPERIELKASLLLSSSVLRRTGEHPRAAMRLAEDVMKALAACHASVFGDVALTETMSEPGVLPPLLLRLLASVESWVAHLHPSTTVIPVLDGLNPTADQRLARRMARTLLRPDVGLPHVLPSPMILDSRASHGLQVADLICHVLLNEARPPEDRKPLGILPSRVQALRPCGQSRARRAYNP